jgi:hypothetical protein
MSLDTRLRRLERLRPRPLEELTDAELCGVIARGTGLTASQVARLPAERLRAIAIAELTRSLAQSLGLTRAQVETLPAEELRALAEAKQGPGAAGEGHRDERQARHPPRPGCGRPSRRGPSGGRWTRAGERPMRLDRP